MGLQNQVFEDEVLQHLLRMNLESATANHLTPFSGDRVWELSSTVKMLKAEKTLKKKRPMGPSSHSAASSQQVS